MISEEEPEEMPSQVLSDGEGNYDLNSHLIN